MSGERRRHHLDESVLQRAVQEAVRGAGLHKPVRCHTFRQMCSCTFDLLPRPESGLGRCSYFHGFPLMAISRITCLCSGVLIFAGLFGRAINEVSQARVLEFGQNSSSPHIVPRERRLSGFGREEPSVQARFHILFYRLCTSGTKSSPLFLKSP